MLAIIISNLVLSLSWVCVALACDLAHEMELYCCRFLRCGLHFLYSAVAIKLFGADATQGMEPTAVFLPFPYNM